KIYEWEYTTTNAVHYVVQGASTTPTNPPSKGTIAQDVPGDPSIDAVAFDSTYIYEAIEGAGAPGQVARKKLDGSDGTGQGTKWFRLPADLEWKNVVVTSAAVFVTATSQLNGPGHPAPDTTAFYAIATSAITADGNATPTVINGLAARGDRISDLSV